MNFENIKVSTIYFVLNLIGFNNYIFFQDEFETKLILEVEARECLYNKRSAYYKDRYKKIKSWKILAVFQIKVVLILLIVCKFIFLLTYPFVFAATECQKRWGSLKDTFSRLYKQTQNTPSGSGAVTHQKWKHFRPLLFINFLLKYPGKHLFQFILTHY